MYIEEDKLTKCEFQPGFYKVADKPCSLNRSGALYDYQTGLFLIAPPDPGNNSYQQTVNGSIHVLMAETFLKIPKGFTRDDVIVNHKDGIKRNNLLSNLEWTSYSGNIIHAYKNGLRTDNLFLKAKSLTTGEITEFYSLQECARHFNVNGNRVFGYLNRKIREAAFLGTHLLVPRDKEFPNFEEAQSWKVSDNRLPTVVYDKRSSTGTVYQTLADAAVSIGVEPKSLTQRKVRSPKGVPFVTEYPDYIVMDISNMPNVSFSIEKDNRSSTWDRSNYLPPVRTKEPATVVNIQTGEKMEFADIYSAGDYIGFRSETIRRREKRGITEHNGFRVIYRPFQLKD